MDIIPGACRRPVDILVVDDLPQQRIAMRAILEDLGENIIAVGSGREALRAVLDRAFAVILLDVNMPGMDGLETASLLRSYRRTARTPIIFVTAYIDDVEMAQGYSLGAVDYISSPVVPEILRSKVKVFVEMHRMHQELLTRAEERDAVIRAEAAAAAAERARQRADFLAAASQTLTRSLEVDTTLQRIVELAAGHLAEAAFVAVRPLGQPSSAANARSAWRQHTEAPDFSEFRENTLAPRFPQIHRCLAAQLDRGVDDAPAGSIEPVTEMATGTSSVDEIRQITLLPMSTGTQQGALLLCWYDVTHAAEPEQTILAGEFVSRAAIAVDNALLFSAIREGDRRKNEFLAMLAHELRNPLAPIANATAVMRSARSEETKVLKWASDIIGTQVEHMVRIVEDLLDVSRIARGTVTLRQEPVVLSAVIGRAVETSRPHFIARAQTFKCDEAAVDVEVSGDVVRLAQIVSNLLNNASKFTPEGGHISLATRFSGGVATITVSDDGHGIDAAFFPHLFELFAQADTSLHRSLGGLGIGLTLVRHLTELHGGTVECHSEGVGKGSTFTVQLPAVMAERSATVRAPIIHLNRKISTRVLVVDDLAASAESLEALLAVHGFSVQCANDGESALQTALKMAPDAVVVDIGLPDMTGYELARRLRDEGGCSQALIIALSGYGREDHRRQALDAGIDHYMVKPADAAALVGLLEAHNEQQRGTAQPGH